MNTTETTEIQRKPINFDYKTICRLQKEKMCDHYAKKEFSIEYWKKNGEKLEKTCILKDLFNYFHDLMFVKLDEFACINQIKEKNGGCNTIKVGSLWDGNKIEDIIFREVCYNNNIFIPVFLNYTNDSAEIISYKLFVANCQILLFDNDIPKSFIDEISNIFLKKYERKILILASDQIFSSSEINQKLDLITYTKGESMNNSQNLSIYSGNHLENSFGTNKIKNDVQNLEYKNISNNLRNTIINQTSKSTEKVDLYKEENKNISNNLDQNLDILKKTDSKIRNIVFTSGSTGKPKGVKLTFSNYLAMIGTLSVLCNNNDNIKSIFVITNPLHHVNSTCFTEYCIRNSSKLVLIHRYSKSYWQILNETIKSSIYYYGNNFSIFVPLVPKHFEYFCSMIENNYFEDSHELLSNLSHPSVFFFFGSSAVSNNLINKFKKMLNEKVPRVRFGSTETCLQLCGADLLMNNSLLKTAFKIESECINNVYSNSIKKSGYFIGRSIQPFAEILVVKSIDFNSDNFLVPTNEFEIGHIICRGKIVMNGYINYENVLITKEILKRMNKNLNKQIPNNMLFICDHHPWYIGLGDQGYWTAGEIKDVSKPSTVHILGEEREVIHINKDSKTIIKEKLNSCACCQDNILLDNIFLYWLSRSSSIIKIGGVKYSSEEINNRIVSTLKNLDNSIFSENFFSTVIGIKDDKISEDDKIVFIYEPFEGSMKLEELIKNKLICSKIPKSYIPCKIVETNIPKTFKGSIDTEKLLEKIKF
ncbi:acyl-synthetase [Cryptosporidium ubiquitum]|uniref:Acyl-synthetase n=1 Tax=Cryptosporidium ubiquitum TaxID=857276 RepID=A0A1J4MJ79_9CRYT|nr:acyl-synthetase [Cryptosporidium ubiquitum]OII74254.1 acyl-synthetase [Cryptosporidium ubiquitum]